MSNEYQKELMTPNYEGHYQRLLATIRELVALENPSIWAIVAGRVGMDYLQRHRAQQDAYHGDVALLATQLVYIDLGALGISPPIARLMLLARLAADKAPMSSLREEVSIAISDVIEAHSADTSADTVLGVFSCCFEDTPNG